MKLRINKSWLLLAIAALPALAADTLAVKTGTWETTVNIKSAGMSMAADLLAKMTAEQRAQMEAFISRMPAAVPKSMTSKNCITQKDIEDGAFKAQQMQKDSKCSYKPGASNTRSHQEWIIDCPGEKTINGGTMVVDAVDPTHVNGVMHIRTPAATIESTFTSKWLGASCTDTN